MVRQAEEADSPLDGDGSDARLVARMRLVLAVSTLLAVYVEARSGNNIREATWLILGGYVLYSAALAVFAQGTGPRRKLRLAHWLDVLWYTLIIGATDGAESLYFLFYVLAALTAAFRWGYEEGARVVLASVASYTACGWLSPVAAGPSQVLLHTAFLLALGHLVVHWGGSKLAMTRRLVLLRKVCRLSNPRFGADGTLECLLRSTRDFYKASHCMLLLRDTASSHWTLRSLATDDPCASSKLETLDNQAARPLLGPSGAPVAVFNRLPSWTHLRGRAQLQQAAGQAWEAANAGAGLSCQRLADMLNARSFITVQLPLARGEGRLIVCSRQGYFRRSDASFLEHLVGQVIPMVEHVQALDHMASQSASQERAKLALDLHDTAIQPYIGLKLGLSALRRKAGADNPLRAELERLSDATEQVIQDLRQYASAVKKGQKPASAKTAGLLPQLRQQVDRVRGLNGMRVDVAVEGNVPLNERLNAQVVQVVREGLNNIYKHTSAQSASVRLACGPGHMSIQIENEAQGGASAAGFHPRSIEERAASLGGVAQVRRGLAGRTAVRVDIPL